MKKLLFETDNEPLSAITHFIGLLLSIAGLVLLVVYASLNGTSALVVGFSIFGASMILLYTISIFYHLLPISSSAKKVMQRIDESMIYVLIAGTYTPVCIAILGGGWGWSLFGVIWLLAAIGIVWKAFFNMSKASAVIFYFIMGWLDVVAFFPVKATLPHAAMFWLFAGGAFYTLGTLLFIIEPRFKKRKWFSIHDLWHVLVMLGSFCHFWLMFKFII